MTSQALVKIDPRQAAALVEDASRQKFLRGLVADDKQAAVALVQLGFSPQFHLAIYQGNLMVTKNGWHWWLSEQEGSQARIVSKPVPKDEREGYGLADDEIGVIAEIFIPGAEGPVATGFGKASTRPYSYQRPRDNAPEAEQAAARANPDRRRNPIDAEYPYNMAEKRAEKAAIEKRCPLPSWIAADTDSRVSAQAPPTEQAPAARTVDAESRRLDPEEDEQRRPLG